MQFAMQALGGDGVLAGSAAGRKAFMELVSETEHPPAPEVCYLDFSGVHVATTSFLRDSVVAYRNYAREHWPHLYPVAANLNATVLEEFSDFLKARGDAFIICRYANGKSGAVRIVGQLDGKQLEALKAVLALGETDVKTIAAKSKEKVATTAWNNRLTALVAKGLLMEIPDGRSKRYRPVLEPLTYGT